MLKKLFSLGNWRMISVLLFGILIGLFVFIFYISNAASYLSDDPKTCVNCHVMKSQYASWFHSSHARNATCNDCHVPHNNVLNKYYFKAKDGMRHATIFTMRGEPQVIQIKEAGKEVVQANCERCHQELIYDAKLVKLAEGNVHSLSDRHCWECHREVPHGRVNSLSGFENAITPLPESPVPDWLKGKTKD